MTGKNRNQSVGNPSQRGGVVTVSNRSRKELREESAELT